MEKLVLFPLNNDTEVLIKNLENCNRYKITAISSYYEDMKRLELLKKEYSFYCSIDLEVCLKDADAVVFAENTMDHSYDGYKERIKKAQELGKKIYICATLLEKLEVDIGKCDFQILQEKTLPKDLERVHIKEIDVPIISIMGLGENCDKFNLQVKVKKLIEKKGYNVLSICSNVLGKFLEMEILPGFLYSKNISYPEKVKAFNSLLIRLQKEYKPDLILLGCPGGILEFEEYETNFYGEIPLVISSATTIDIGIVALYANSEQNADSAKKLSDFCLMKYNTEVKDYVMSKKYFKADYEWKKIRYYEIEERDNTENRAKNVSEYHVSCIEDDSEIEEQVNIILNKFENNFHVI